MTRPEGKRKPAVMLVGEDGNAFAIIGRCRTALKRAGYTNEEVAAFSQEAMSGDYDHVLMTAMEWCAVDEEEDDEEEEEPIGEVWFAEDEEDE
ncbi:MAG: hypothetical protein M0R22_13220 [Dehalococcoidia bacterium]|jgi:hypothetical protein|nr:hypothetical protein [Dehalococcoidia bacterium]